MSDNDDFSTDDGSIDDSVSRRAVLKAAGAAGIAGSGLSGIASAAPSNDCSGVTGHCAECRDTGCRAHRGSCTQCLTDECDEIAGTRLEAGRDFEEDLYCVEIPASDVPTGASKAVIKAANECHECAVTDPSQPQTLCVDSKHAISHVEFAACPGASVAADCADDAARIDVHSLDRVAYEVSYEDCDAAGDSGTLSGEGDRWSATVPIAACAGTVTVTTADGGQTLAATSFDCETASVSVDCPSGEATITANDTTDVWYAIDYDGCDAADVTRTGPVDLSGAVDSVSVSVADCEGTVTITDDDERVLDEAAFDCESASVSVDCAAGEATVSAPDTDAVTYEITYDGCDAADVDATELALDGDTDSATVPIADCGGRIAVTDDDGRLLDEATFDCESVADLTVDCPADSVTVAAPATNDLWYEIEYERCDAADVGRSPVPGLSASSDEGVVSGLANCEGTVRVYADEDSAAPLASTTFDCETASVSADCSAGEATISAPDADEVFYAIDYDGCDEADVPRSGPVDLSGDVDSATVSIANCQGRIEISDDDERVLDEAAFDCETASVAVDCPAGEATISAPDTDEVFYAIDYDGCDETDVSRTPVDLSGETDEVSVPVANCEGTVTLTDDDERVLDEATFDCASASVSVDCVDETATISSPDASEVWYAIDYAEDCPTADVSRTSVDLSGSTDSVTVGLPGDCAGQVTVTDDDERTLATAAFDCAPAVTDLAADCDRVVATLDAPALGDSVSLDVAALDAGGSTVGTASSGDLTVEAASSSGGQVAFDYGDAVEADAWEAVSVTVTHAGLGEVVHEETVQIDGSCGCAECSSGLSLKFEGGTIAECESLSAEGATFTITDVETKPGTDEPMAICFAADAAFCELDVALKAGPHVGSTVVTPSTDGEAENCPGLDGDVREFCVDVSVTGQEKNAISWMTIRCP